MKQHCVEKINVASLPGHQWTFNPEKCYLWTLCVSKFIFPLRLTASKSVIIASHVPPQGISFCLLSNTARMLALGFVKPETSLFIIVFVAYTSAYSPYSTCILNSDITNFFL